VSSCSSRDTCPHIANDRSSQCNRDTPSDSSCLAWSRSTTEPPTTVVMCRWSASHRSPTSPIEHSRVVLPTAAPMNSLVRRVLLSRRRRPRLHRLPPLQSSESLIPRGLTAMSRQPSCSSRWSPVIGALEPQSSEPTCSCREETRADPTVEVLAL